MLSYLQHSIKWRKTFYTFSDPIETELSVLIDKFTKGKNGNLFSNESDDIDNDVHQDSEKECKKDEVKEDEQQDEKEVDQDVKKEMDKKFEKEDEQQDEKQINQQHVNQYEDVKQQKQQYEKEADNIKKFEQMITEKEDFPDVRKNPKFRLLYKKLLLKYHPDKTGGDETIFSNIREDVEDKHFLFFIKYTRESFIDYYKDDIDTWTFIVKSHVEKWKKIVYAMT